MSGITLLCHTRRQYAEIGNTRFVQKAASRKQGQHGYCLRKSQSGAKGHLKACRAWLTCLGLSRHSQHGKEDLETTARLKQKKYKTVRKYSSDEARVRPAWKPKHRSGSGPATPCRARLRARPRARLKSRPGSRCSMARQGLQLSQTHPSSDTAQARRGGSLAEVK